MDGLDFLSLNGQIQDQLSSLIDQLDMHIALLQYSQATNLTIHSKRYAIQMPSTFLTEVP